MSKIIYKYPILQPQEDPVMLSKGNDSPVLKSRFSVELPVGSELLHVATVREVPWLWVLHDDVTGPTLMTREQRWFRIYGTGHKIDDWRELALTHVGTFIIGPSAMVWHMFEEGRSHE